MSRAGARVDALIYGKVDIRQLETIGETREIDPVNDYTNSQVSEMISWLEWFEPDSPILDTIQDDLLNSRKSVYRILNDVLIGVYGKHERTMQGANYFSLEYLNADNLENFFQVIGQRVKRRGRQKETIPDIKSRVRISCTFDAIIPRKVTKIG